MTSQGQRDSKDRDQLEDMTRERVEVSHEMSRLLESRRWDVQEGPFQGFRSPPGRF